MTSVTHMTREEYVADYLDRRGVIGFPTNKQVQAARDEYEELREADFNDGAGDDAFINRQERYGREW